MANLIGTSHWNNFRNAMKDAHDTFHQKTILWKRLKSTLDIYGEDNDQNGYDDVNLKVQLNYNYNRSWPVTFKTESGELDRQSVQVLINKQYLSELGYLDSNNYFNFSPANDIFYIDGLRYICMGDTAVSQAFDDDILISIILKRDDTKTNQQR